MGNRWQRRCGGADFDAVKKYKAVKAMAPEPQAQLLNPLKANGLRLGVIVNFGHPPKAEIQRIAHDTERK